MNPCAFMGFFFTLTLVASTGRLFAGVDAPVPATDPTEMQRQRDQLVLENQISDEALRRELAAGAASSAGLVCELE
jgi:hypothetical protein